MNVIQEQNRSSTLHNHQIRSWHSNSRWLTEATLSEEEHSDEYLPFPKTYQNKNHLKSRYFKN